MGWYNKFKSLVKIENSNIYAFIEALQINSTSVTIQIIQSEIIKNH